MRITRRRQPQGIALVIVLVSIFVLASLAGIFAYSMKVEVKLAANAYDANDLEWLGRSGVEYARFLLAEQMKNAKQQYDSLDQIWAGGQGDTNDPLSGYSLTDVELGKGKFSLKITDLERKFNVNTALNPQSEQIMQKALTSIGVDAAVIPTIIASIQDWIDPDDDTHVNGAESEYYKGLDPPYLAKNGPVDDISELLFIKGVTPDVYWGAKASQHTAAGLPSAAKDLTRSGLLPTGTGTGAGLVDIFTPFSNGHINILTASAEQLQVLPLVDETVAGEIIQLRQQGGAEGSGVLVYRTPVDLLVNTSLGRQMGPQIAGLCTFRSSYFDVQVTAQIGQSKRICHALLFRNNPKDIQISSFYWE
ncbi:MAG TPA: general secretion pathway protein GspK [Verrucomicrobiae bacterium]|nr:general secretion pathway protein GspK [Verrucomicrobiae bacterium]